MVGNGEAIDLPDASIDCITNIESLYYYPKPEAALKEWARITKSGGQLAMMMDSVCENPATHNWIEALDVPVRLFSMRQLQQVIRSEWLDRSPDGSKTRSSSNEESCGFCFEYRIGFL